MPSRARPRRRLLVHRSTRRRLSISAPSVPTVVGPARRGTASIDHRTILVVPLVSRPTRGLTLAPRSSDSRRRTTSFYVYKGRARPSMISLLIMNRSPPSLGPNPLPGAASGPWPDRPSGVALRSESPRWALLTRWRPSSSARRRPPSTRGRGPFSRAPGRRSPAPRFVYLVLWS